MCEKSRQALRSILLTADIYITADRRDSFFGGIDANNSRNRSLTRRTRFSQHFSLPLLQNRGRWYPMHYFQLRLDSSVLILRKCKRKTSLFFYYSKQNQSFEPNNQRQDCGARGNEERRKRSDINKRQVRLSMYPGEIILSLFSGNNVVQR